MATLIVKKQLGKMAAKMGEENQSGNIIFECAICSLRGDIHSIQKHVDTAHVSQDNVNVSENNNQSPDLSSTAKLDDGLWSHEETHALIALYKKHINDFNRAKKRILVWKMISEELSNIGIVHSATKCQRKWLNMVRVYRRKKDKRRTSCSSIYFDKLDEILGHRSNTTNSESIIIGVEEANDKIEPESSENDEVAILENSSAKMKRENSDNENVTPKKVKYSLNCKQQKFIEKNFEVNEEGSKRRELKHKYINLSPELSSPAKLNNDTNSGFWSQKDTLALITCYENHIEDFHNAKNRKFVWRMISEELSSMDIMHSAAKCQRKWFNLLRVYRSKKDNRTKTGTPFIYFNKLDKILDRRPSDRTNSESINISFEEETSNKIEPNSQENDEVTAPESSGANTKNKNLDNTSKKAKNSLNFKIQEYFEKKLEAKKEENERKEQRHKELVALEKERLALERRKIEVLENFLKYKENNR